MSNGPKESAIAIATDIMQSAVRIMQSFPLEFEAPDEERPRRDAPEGLASMAADVQQILSEPAVAKWLHATIDSWPQGLFPAFVNTTSVIAQILRMFGAGRQQSMMSFGLVSDPRNLDLLSAIGQMRKEIEGLPQEDGTAGRDPTGMLGAMEHELHRRMVAHATPFARTLTTLLGPDALLWLVAQSGDGMGKLQPHEFSRAGWPQLWEMETQLAIEQELLRIDPDGESVAKVLVALAWTAVALATFMTPAIFLGEETPYLSSQRPGHYTVSVGRGTRTTVRFHPPSMIRLVSVLEAGLHNELLSTADLMWAGAALARVHTIQAGTGGSPTPHIDEPFEIFLSHRGRDAKRELASAARYLPKDVAFLDCLTLPRGVINRMFIYASIARSKRILIIETPNFHESEWCRKEAWFAEAMAAQGMARVVRGTLMDGIRAIDQIRLQRQQGSPAPRSTYPIAQRVLRDIDYHGRQPNLYTLQESGHATEVFAPIQALLAGDEHVDDAAWMTALGGATTKMLERVVDAAPDANPRSMWTTAAQYAVAAFTLSSHGRSKMTVRDGIDDLNEAIDAVVDSELARDSTFTTQQARYLGLIASAAAIAIAGFELDSRFLPVIQQVIGDTAYVHRGVLLVDARERGPVRAFRLRLVATLVQQNLGSVGIIQNADDQVHQSLVDDLPIEILPCVTLYPDMDWLLG
jgi:hypothetical protein